MTPAECKKTTKAYLEEHEIPFDKLTAKTISFQDLARMSCVFVTIHGVPPQDTPELWNGLEQHAITHGFRVERG